MDPNLIALIGTWILGVGIFLWDTNRSEKRDAASILEMDDFTRKPDIEIDDFTRKTDTEIDDFTRKTDTEIDDFTRKTDTEIDDFTRKTDTEIDDFTRKTDGPDTRIAEESKVVHRDIAAQRGIGERLAFIEGHVLGLRGSGKRGIGERLAFIEGHLLGPRSFGGPGTGADAAAGEPPPE